MRHARRKTLLVPAVALVVLVLPILIIGLIARRRWLWRRDGGVIAFSPMVHAILWVVALVNHVWLDLNPRLSIMCLALP